MKKILLSIVSFIMLLGLIACTQVTLDAPVISISGSVVSWNSVNNADGYTVLVNLNSYETTNTSFELKNLELRVGTYQVSVIAHSKDKKEKSKVSNVISYVVEAIISDELVERLLKVIDPIYHLNMVSEDFYDNWGYPDYYAYQRYLRYKDNIINYLKVVKETNLTNDSKYEVYKLSYNFFNSGEISVEDMVEYFDLVTEEGLTSITLSEIIYEYVLLDLEMFIEENDDTFKQEEFREVLINDKVEIINALESFVIFTTSVRSALNSEVVDALNQLIEYSEITNDSIILIKNAVVDELLYNLPSKEAFEVIINLLTNYAVIIGDNANNIDENLFIAQANNLRSTLENFLEMIKNFTLSELNELVELIKESYDEDVNIYKLISFVSKQVSKQFDFEELLTKEEFEDLVETILETIHILTDRRFAVTDLDIIYDLYKVIGSKTEFLLENDLLPILLMTYFTTKFGDHSALYYSPETRDVLASEIVKFYGEFSEEDKQVLMNIVAYNILFYNDLEGNLEDFPLLMEALDIFSEFVDKIVPMFENQTFVEASQLFEDQEIVIRDAYVIVEFFDSIFSTDAKDSLISALKKLDDSYTQEMDYNSYIDEWLETIDEFENNVEVIKTYDFGNLNDDEIFAIKIFINKLIPGVYPYPKGQQGVTDTEILIGNTAATSGVFAGVGIPFNQGIEAYLKQVNDAGGVNGRQIRFVNYNDDFNAELGFELTRKLVKDDEVFALVGHFGNLTVSATLDYIQDIGIPMVYALTGINQLYFENTPKNPVLSVQPIYKTEGRIMTARALNESVFGVNGNQKLANNALIGVIHATSEDGLSFKEGIEAEIEWARENDGFSGSVIYKEFSYGDYASLEMAIFDLKAAGVEVIIVAATQMVFRDIVVALEEEGLHVPVFTSYINANSISIDHFVDYSFDIYVNHWLDISKQSEDFVQTFEGFIAAFDAFDPNLGVMDMSGLSYAIAGYIAAHVFVEGLKAVGSDKLTWASYIEAMETIPKIDIPMGGIVSFNDGRRWGTSSMSLLKLDNSGSFPDWIMYKPIEDIEDIRSK